MLEKTSLYYDLIMNINWFFCSHLNLEHKNRRSIYMKTKKISKKLQINKSTVSNLSHDELSLAQGGSVQTYDYYCLRLSQGACIS